jgi:hypothetical protein
MNHASLAIVAIVAAPAALLAAGRSILIMSISLVLALSVAYPIFVGISSGGGDVGVVSDLTIYQEAKADSSGQHGANGNADSTSETPFILGGIGNMPNFDDSSSGNAAGNGGVGGMAVYHGSNANGGTGGDRNQGNSGDSSSGNGGIGGKGVYGGTANGGDGSSNGKGNGGNGGMAVGQGSDASGTAAIGDTNGFDGGVAVNGGHTDPANGCNVAVGSQCFNTS